MIAVSILKGISAEVAVLAISSIKRRKKAPIETQVGNKFLWLGPTSILPICGTTRPTQPTMPHREIAEAVITVEVIMISHLSR